MVVTHADRERPKPGAGMSACCACRALKLTPIVVVVPYSGCSARQSTRALSAMSSTVSPSGPISAVCSATLVKTSCRMGSPAESPFPAGQERENPSRNCASARHLRNSCSISALASAPGSALTLCRSADQRPRTVHRITHAQLDTRCLWGMHASRGHPEHADRVGSPIARHPLGQRDPDPRNADFAKIAAAVRPADRLGNASAANATTTPEWPPRPGRRWTC